MVSAECRQACDMPDLMTLANQSVRQDLSCRAVIIQQKNAGHHHARADAEAIAPASWESTECDIFSLRLYPLTLASVALPTWLSALISVLLSVLLPTPTHPAS